ncbi:hypothetical protein AWB78_07337 [Caballeronia calidae]|uniref:Uncharacterized protein n=1 Tax=Caballeronia calidae TaxID=1777139 RepID=A0A158EEN7_9BURK|nr:hypothetical protein [Caballeronia calidae]SAL05170.1 hypothetical protein AWB78_07337 [Caballeronia calidae]
MSFNGSRPTSWRRRRFSSGRPTAKSAIPFFHVIREDKPARAVTEENVVDDPVADDPNNSDRIGSKQERSGPRGKKYISDQDEDQLAHLIGVAQERLDNLRQSGWVYLWIVSGWCNSWLVLGGPVRRGP